MAGNFIKLYRELEDSKIFANEKYLKVFIWLLLNASYKQTSFPIKVGAGTSIITLNRGELLYGRHVASKKLNISEQSLKTILKYLQTDGTITVKSTNHYSIITICNYETYQGCQSDNQPTTNQQLTNNQPTTNQQLTTYKKDNNYNKENNTYIASGQIEKSIEFYKSQSELFPDEKYKLFIERIITSNNIVGYPLNNILSIPIQVSYNRFKLINEIYTQKSQEKDMQTILVTINNNQKYYTGKTDLSIIIQNFLQSEYKTTQLRHEKS